MDVITMKREVLVNRMKENRDTHRADFEKAIAGYHKQIIEILEKHIERAKRGKPEKVVISIPFPEDHTPEYDRLIDALEVSPFEEVQLSLQDFNSYYRDDWAWKQQWTTSNAAYIASASS